MTPFQAAMIADGEWGLAGIEESSDAYIEAYQQMIDDGTAWQLQGRIGREAARLLEAGLCHPPKPR